MATTDTPREARPQIMEPGERADRVAKRLAFVAGLAALLAACLFYPILGRFDQNFRAHGFDTAEVLSPFARALLAKHGLIPTGLLAIFGIFSVASSFSGRRKLTIAAGFLSLLMAGASGVVIPVVLMEALSRAVGKW
ncbi:hypothetical protein [Luteolibacter luteus]|uniref:Uncharacterized protein n=1 Tax=Luteolibacter luteus TaxID=2728835 RepID=A0A858RF07_9BACT|nr:hypothetical protein [Luteolibacter luteus]QJE95128.1 hypothetical protein HHL09_04860 [Luteolibacter luteus]